MLSTFNFEFFPTGVFIILVSCTRSRGEGGAKGKTGIRRKEARVRYLDPSFENVDPLCYALRNETNGGNRKEGETIERYSLGQTNFDYRYYSYYSLDDGFFLVSLDSASQHLSLLRRTLFYTRLFNHYSANSIISRIKSRNKRTLRSQKKKKEKNRNYRFSSPIFSISRD